MTETVNEDNLAVLCETASSNEKIMKKKTIVYETHVDPTVVKVAAEKIKVHLFTRLGFLKPRPEEVQFVSIEKYYEPFSLISGKYSIDYYRKCTYLIGVNPKVQEVLLLNNKFEPERSMDFSRDQRVVKIEGEERLKNEVKASFVLDKSGQEIPLEKLSSAPSETHAKKIMAEFGLEESAGNADLDIIRSRVVKRPADVSRVICELFEVDERAEVFTPRYKVLYRNLKTGEEGIVEFDGVTAEKVQQSKRPAPRDVPPVPPPPPP